MEAVHASTDLASSKMCKLYAMLTWFRSFDLLVQVFDKGLFKISDSKFRTPRFNLCSPLWLFAHNTRGCHYHDSSVLILRTSFKEG